MSDLISRQEVLKLVDRGYLISNGNYQKVRKMVESLPSAEPERCEDCGNFNKTTLLIPQPERKRGRWTLYERCDPVFDIGGVKTWGMAYRCSECGFIHTVIEDFGMYDFCPECGADMREREVES